jgi:hypothetical protein
VEQVFGKDLANNTRFKLTVTAALDRLINRGSHSTLEAFRSAFP